MNVTEFVNKYNSFKTDKDREVFLNSVKRCNYLPIAKKVEVCKEVFDLSSTKNFNIPFNVIQYIYFVMIIIDNYTNINVDYNNICFEYDRLREFDLLQLVLSLISEDEIAELNLVRDSSYGVINGVEN